MPGKRKARDTPLLRIIGILKDIRGKIKKRCGDMVTAAIRPKREAAERLLRIFAPAAGRNIARFLCFKTKKPVIFPKPVAIRRTVHV